MAGSIVSAILAATTNAQLRAAMLMGARLESGWNLQAVGDQGSSFGPFQIHLPAHPGVSSGQAQDAGWATAYMMPAYQAGVNKVASGLWASDPAQAAALAAFYAERPAKMYGTSNYQADWVFVQQALQGQDVGAASGFSPLGGAVAGGASDAAAGVSGASAVTTGIVPSTTTIERDVSDVLNYGWMAGIILGGVILMSMGIVILMKEGASHTSGIRATVPTQKVKAKVTVKKAVVKEANPRAKPAIYRSSTPRPKGNVGKGTQSSAGTTSRKPVPATATRTRAVQSAGRPQRNVKVISP